MISANPWRLPDADCALAHSILLKIGVIEENAKPLGRPKFNGSSRSGPRKASLTQAQERKILLMQLMQTPKYKGRKTTEDWVHIFNHNSATVAMYREVYDTLRSMFAEGKVTFTKQPKILGGWTMWQSKE